MASAVTTAIPPLCRVLLLLLFYGSNFLSLRRVHLKGNYTSVIPSTLVPPLTTITCNSSKNTNAQRQKKQDHPSHNSGKTTQYLPKQPHTTSILRHTHSSPITRHHRVLDPTIFSPFPLSVFFKIPVICAHHIERHQQGKFKVVKSNQVKLYSSARAHLQIAKSTTFHCFCQ